MSDRPSARLCGLGAATPALARSQEAIEQEFAALWRLSRSERDLWRRIVEGSGVDCRYACIEPAGIVQATTGERMAVYAAHAPGLAVRAAKRAMAKARVAPCSITDLIVVSCTGFAAPGVDVALVDGLGLDRGVRRTVVGFMGCFGAIPGLRAAIGGCAARGDAVALVVCVELCSLHLRSEHTPQDMVAAALFGDGAAAAVVAGADAPIATRAIAELGLGETHLAPRREDGDRAAMTWTISDHGFIMTLSPALPQEIESMLAGAIGRTLCGAAAGAAPAAWIAHPGGPRILDAVERAFGLDAEALHPSRDVLRRFGNMSSATVLFVLDAALRGGDFAAGDELRLIAFGPGLTIETLATWVLRPAAPAAARARRDQGRGREQGAAVS